MFGLHNGTQQLITHSKSHAAGLGTWEVHCGRRGVRKMRTHPCIKTFIYIHILYGWFHVPSVSSQADHDLIH
jgi:hypothetical protein